MLYYNGSTAPGSSGAPVFSINNPSEAIGVHIAESNKSSFDAMFVDISSVAGWLRNQLAY
jgi:V8-like Glu-specific endopeptidase